MFVTYLGGNMHYGEKGKLVEVGCDALGNVLWEHSGPGSHTCVTLTHIAYINIAAVQVHPFMTTAFPNVCGLF